MDNQEKKPKFSLSSQVLQSLFENGKSPLSEQFLRWKLWAKWSEVVGPTIAQNAEPVGLRYGTLYVWVKNSTWMQQMVFMKDQMQETINRKMEKDFVKNIRFTLNRHEVPGGQDQQANLKDQIARVTPNKPK